MAAKLYGGLRKSRFRKIANFMAAPTLWPKQCKRYGRATLWPTAIPTWPALWPLTALRPLRRIDVVSVMTVRGVMTTRRIDMTTAMAGQGAMTVPSYRYDRLYDRSGCYDRTAVSIWPDLWPPAVSIWPVLWPVMSYDQCRLKHGLGIRTVRLYDQTSANVMAAKLYGGSRKSRFWKIFNFKAASTLWPKHGKRYGRSWVMTARSSAPTSVMAVLRNRYGRWSLRGGRKTSIPRYYNWC